MAPSITIKKTCFSTVWLRPEPGNRSVWQKNQLIIQNSVSKQTWPLARNSSWRGTLSTDELLLLGSNVTLILFIVMYRVSFWWMPWCCKCIKACVHKQCGSGILAEQCNFNRKFPNFQFAIYSISNEYLLFSHLCKHHFKHCFHWRMLLHCCLLKHILFLSVLTLTPWLIQHRDDPICCCTTQGAKVNKIALVSLQTWWLYFVTI